MNEKRKHPRFSCHMKVRFAFFEGDPDTIDVTTSKPHKDKGLILDISRGGVFIATNARVSVGLPAIIEFRTRRDRIECKGTIVRTGLLKNNPSDVVQKYREQNYRQSSYLAVRFEAPLDFICEEDLHTL